MPRNSATTPEERLEGVIDHDPVLAAAGRNRRRLTEVVTYTNYQLVSRRGHGPGWVMTGDAFGFVDPMLSPGMWLALHSAELLAEQLDDLPAYSREMRKLIKAWMGLIQYFYDGRIFAMYQDRHVLRAEISRQNRRRRCMVSSTAKSPAWPRARPRPRGLATACCKSCRVPPPGKPIPPRWRSGEFTGPRTVSFADNLVFKRWVQSAPGDGTGPDRRGQVRACKGNGGSLKERADALRMLAEGGSGQG